MKAKTGIKIGKTFCWEQCMNIGGKKVCGYKCQKT